MTASVGHTPPDGWETHRREQLATETAASPLQRLRWLEEAIAFAFRAGALPPHTIDSSQKPGSSSGAEPRVS